MLNPTDNRQVSPPPTTGSPVPVNDAPATQKIAPVSQSGAASLQYAADNFNRTESGNAPLGDAQPVLTPPSADSAKVAAGLDFYSVYNACQEAINGANKQTVQSNSAFDKLITQARADNLAAAQRAVDSAETDLIDANLDLAEKVARASDAAVAVDSAAAALSTAQAQLNVTANQLAAARADHDAYPEDPAFQKKFDDASALSDVSYQALAAAQGAQLLAQQYLAQADSAVEQATDISITATQQLADSTNAFLTMSNHGTGISDAAAIKLKSNMAILNECMANLISVLSNYDKTKLSNAANLFKLRQQAIQEQLIKLAADIAVAEAKAAKSQRILKIVVKVLSWTVVALSGAAAIASGGLGSGLVALAVTGVAIADEVLDDAGQKTATDAALEPVLAAFTQGFSNMIRKMKPDADNDTVEAAASVLAIIALMGCMAAASGGASKVVGNRLPQFSFINSDKLAGLRVLMESTTAVVELASTGTQVGMHVEVANLELESKDGQGEMALATAAQTIMQQVFKDIVDQTDDSKDSLQLFQFAAALNEQHSASIRQLAQSRSV